MQSVSLGDNALARLREIFIAVEGTCEAWTDEEIVTRMLIRGAMEYAKSSGAEWSQVQELAGILRSEVRAGGSAA